jgi:hypothetical protein
MFDRTKSISSSPRYLAVSPCSRSVEPAFAELFESFRSQEVVSGRIFSNSLLRVLLGTDEFLSTLVTI